MANIIKQCDVKISQKDYEALGEAMGCTAKAIKHRVAKIKNGTSISGKEEDGGEDTGIKTKGKAAGGGKKGKRGKRARDDEGEGEEKESKKVKAEEEDGEDGES
jgi:hypothetical protein